MYHYTTNPPSRQIAPTPAFVRTHFPIRDPEPDRRAREAAVDSDGNSALLSRIARFCQRHAVAATAFGRQVANDARLVDDLAAGRRLGTKLARRIDAALNNGGVHA